MLRAIPQKLRAQSDNEPQCLAPPGSLTPDENISCSFGARLTSESQFLELVLSYAVPSKDLPHVVRNLLAKFESVAYTINANPIEILSACADFPVQIVKSVIDRLLSIKLAINNVIFCRLTSKPIIYNGDVLINYLIFLIGREASEKIAIIYVNIRNEVYGIEELSVGSPRSVSVGAAAIMSRVTAKNAPSFILAHNHPSGDVAPSEQDIVETDRIREISRSLAIEFRDHIIVSAENWFSFRGADLF